MFPTCQIDKGEGVFEGFGRGEGGQMSVNWRMFWNESKSSEEEMKQGEPNPVPTWEKNFA